MSDKILFSPAKLGVMPLKNHMVMAPMTRNRASEHNVPQSPMSVYYGQRATAGLIITEGTTPSPNGAGYPRIPGLYNDEQVRGWKEVTQAVHEKGGKIFVQLMHTGRVGNNLNLPEGAQLLGPSAVVPQGEIYTDKSGMQPYSLAKEMDQDQINAVIAEYAHAAQLAIEAGFDGVEIHGANGYLVEQFINPGSNQRHDNYGGSIENRARFALEVASAIVNEIGAEKVGIRLSPHGAFNDMLSDYPELEDTYAYIAEHLKALGLVYIHLVDHSKMGAPEVPVSTVKRIKEAFNGNLILSGGYDLKSAEEALASGRATLVAFGKTFLANPDLPSRLEDGLNLNDPDFSTFYTPGAKGYIDYPTYQEAMA